MELQTIQSHLRVLFNEAVSSVNPQKLIQDNVKIMQRDGVDYLVVGGKNYNLQLNVCIVGFGKAVLGMAKSFEHLIKAHLKAGIISVPVGTLSDRPDFMTSKDNCRCKDKLKIIEGAKNNLPDNDAQAAAQKITDLVKGLNAGTVLIVLISGGGSALLPLPVPTITLEEKLNLIKLLANAGADIVDLNCVRKKLSQVKGGKLAFIAYPAQVISLIISDVVGNSLETIASGPTCPDFDAPDLAWEITQKYNLESKISENVIQVLTSRDDIRHPSDFSHVNNVVIGSNAIALAAINAKAQSMNYNTVVLSDKIQGIARNISSIYASLATNICQLWSSKLQFEEFVIECETIQMECKVDFPNTDLQQAIDSSKILYKPLCLVLGGETTVQVSGSGIGGRNQELALSFAIDMCERREKHSVLDNYEVVLLSAGTDGMDGPTDVAGAIGHSQLINQARAQNIDPTSYLNDNNSYNFFTTLSDGEYFIKTGHTGTNVMDVHILIIAPLSKE